MAGWLKKLFSANQESREQHAKPPRPSGRASNLRKNELSASEADKFLASIRPLGRPDHPILSKDYSTSSRVPCTDLIPFLSERLLCGDVRSVKSIMRAVIEGNPGIGIGPDWIDESIDKIVVAPFENYVSFGTQAAYSELRALFIVAAKAGGGREFLISESIPRYMAWVLFPHQPEWSTDTELLAKKANAWIRKMAKETPFWEDYGRLRAPKVQTVCISESLRATIVSLSPAGRLQLIYAITKGGGSLPELTNYDIRSFGINVAATSNELIKSGLMISSAAPEVIESAFTKQEILGLCEAYGASFKKSWTKSKLVDALQSLGSEPLQRISLDNSLAAPNYTTYPELANILQVADTHEAGFKLLCFS
ncbi:hypothetical protein [Thiocapsa sp.]|uniref:hypothetical protein n=1 Tax=Thiocapsa sp. TaxID=2024551 RepID=UPI002C2267F8|nr:hypothetical protein [Thiocapsa sp.]HSO83511.1 hypothetical protein [Thiocapsa sp.]